VVGGHEMINLTTMDNYQANLMVWSAS